jgi:membrane associated rhomboid family serine protease
MSVSPQQLAAIQYQYGVVPLRDWPLGASSGPSSTGTQPPTFVSFLSAQFLHGGMLHLAMNLAMLLQTGPICEAGLGRGRDASVRFVGFFLACGVLGGLTYCVFNPLADAPAIGASGAISGVFGGFLWAAIGLAKPGQRMLRPVLSSAVVFLLINVGLAWVGRVSGFIPIAWEAHLGGFIAGVLLYPLFARFGRRNSG